MINNPYKAYKQQSVMTMTQGEMLKMVYDGLIKEIELSKTALEEKDFTLANEKLQKAQRIIAHLQNTLNFDYEISNNLFSLYDYFNHVILQANIKKNSENLQDVIDMVKNLRNTYNEADKLTRLGN